MKDTVISSNLGMIIGVPCPYDRGGGGRKSFKKDANVEYNNINNYMKNQEEPSCSAVGILCPDDRGGGENLPKSVKCTDNRGGWNSPQEVNSRNIVFIYDNINNFTRPSEEGLLRSAAGMCTAKP